MGGKLASGGRLRRALASTSTLVVASALLVAHAPAAHAAFTPCDAGGPACVPGAVDDLYTVAFNTKLTVNAAKGLLSNDTGPTGTAVDTGPNQTDTTSFNGFNVSVQADGSFTYKPDTTFSGADFFFYVIKDNNGNRDSAMVTIKVTPIVTPDSYTVAENHVLNVGAPGVLANDAGYDPFGNVTGDTHSAHGGPVLVLGDGSFVYTPPHNFVGVDTFHYSVPDLDGTLYPGTVTVTVNAPPPPPVPKPRGYWMVGSTGIVYPFGTVQNFGNAPTGGVTHLEPTPTRKGYWIVNAAGTVYAFGDAKVFGAPLALRSGEIVSSLSSTPTGRGYWLFTNRGRVAARGDAAFLGDMRGVTLNGPVVGSVATPTGRGYYMVGSDGGIFSFGDAKFHGSMGGVKLNQPVNGIVPTATNRGYWLVASDGGIFGFGDATFRGSMGGTRLNRPVIGMVRYGNGYLMVASDGGIFTFSNLSFLGSLGGLPIPAPIVGVGAGS